MSNNNNGSGGGDGVFRRGLEDSKIESARKFLYESSDDDSFASSRDGYEDNFPVNVQATMPQRKGYKFRTGGSTNLSSGGGRGGDVSKPEPGLARRCCNTLRFRCGSIREKGKNICAVLVLVAVVVFGVAWAKEGWKNGGTTGTSALGGGGSDNGAKHPKKKHPKLHGNRLEKFHQMIVGQGYSSEELLNTPGSPEALALEWIANHDPAKIKPSYDDDDDHFTCERFALAVLFYTTSGTADLEEPSEKGHWADSTNWLTGKGICAWSGITCEGDVPEADYDDRDHHGTVERIELSELGLMGTIPREVASFPKLYKLDLSKNELTGTIPRVLERLTGLRELVLSHNMLSGDLPQGFGTALTNLRHLLLGSNRLEGIIHSDIVGHLVELRSLGLEQNELTGTIPDLEQLAKITTLDLSDNLLEGPFPESVVRLTSLVNLDIGHNHLTGTFPEDMAELTALERLMLREMNLHGSLPAGFFGKVTRLTNFGVSGNKISGTIPTEVGRLKDLEGMYLGQNKISGTIPRQVGLMADLIILEIQGNKLSGSIPDLVGSMKDLEIFSAARNHLSGTIPAAMGQMHRLQSLFVENNKLTGDVPTQLGKLHGLKQCRLYDNRLKGKIPREVCDLIEDEDLVFLGADCGHDFVCECCTRCYQ